MKWRTYHMTINAIISAPFLGAFLWTNNPLWIIGTLISGIIFVTFQPEYNNDQILKISQRLEKLNIASVDLSVIQSHRVHAATEKIHIVLISISISFIMYILILSMYFYPDIKYTAPHIVIGMIAATAYGEYIVHKNMKIKEEIIIEAMLEAERVASNPIEAKPKIKI
jgi:hypothetical protein